MNFSSLTLSSNAVHSHKTDALVILVPEGLKPARGPLADWLTRHLKNGDFSTQVGFHLSLFEAPGWAAKRVCFVGIGSASAAQVRQALTAAWGALKGAKPEAITVWLPESATDLVGPAMQALADASYVFTTTKPSAKARTLKRVTMAMPDAVKHKTEFVRQQALVEGVEWAKEWANRPANHATPSMLAKAAQSLGKHRRMRCQVLGPKEVDKLGMGSFAAVSQASAEPLRFIVLNYTGASKSKAPVVLVGKGITFDTGGISLKPGAGMDEMKFDMCGAASVMGTFLALAKLQPAINVVGLIPACENMPDGRALKPGDVVTSMSGQTIEILNTDAEGRLILCDALTYAKRFKPSAVIDIATLTGACVIALGHVRSGMYASDDGLAKALETAGEAAQDLCWRMPLDEAYAEGLKSNFADVANVADRAAGSVTAAKFLQRFATDFPWAHLDIAGTAWKSGAAKGATGRPVGLLLHYLLSQTETGKR
jgi:leucyl aminopeptidase